jgi:polygalacturonase
VITATVDGHDLWPLVIIAEEYDPSAPQSAGPVLDVADLGVTHDGVQTANIQRALDACAARPGGGVVYFGPGVYHTGTLYVGDNTTVYLAPGCLIQASEDPNDFPVDKGRKEQGSHGPVSSSSRVIMFDHCTNSKLSGYGVIDGMGHVIRNKHGRHVQLVDVTASRNVRIENVVLRNSAEWTVHILASDRVFIDNLKIINDYKVGNTDGIDPDGSTNVYITRYFGHCGDDALAIKTTGNSDLLQPARNINVRDCIVMTRKTAYKIGTETYADISDVLFQDCDAVNSSRGIGIWCRDGGVISDVTYRDMSFDLHEIEGESHSGEPIYVSVEKRNGIGKVVDVLFDRVVSRAPYRSLFEGMAQSKLTDFKLWGCRFYLKPREIKMGRQPVISIADADGFQFRFTYLQRPADDDQNWNGFIEAKDSENIVSRELEETRADN